MEGVYHGPHKMKRSQSNTSGEDSDDQEIHLEAVAYVSLLLYVLAYIPTITRINQRKSMKDFSESAIVLRLAAASLGLLYAWNNRINPYIASGVVFVAINVYLLKRLYELQKGRTLPSLKRGQVGGAAP